jgi:hypothetical protein
MTPHRVSGPGVAPGVPPEAKSRFLSITIIAFLFIAGSKNPTITEN